MPASPVQPASPAPSAPPWNPWVSWSFTLLAVALIYEAVSGLYLYAVENMGKTVMVTLFLHVLIGVLGTVPFLAFVVRHVRTARIEEILASRVDRFLRNSAWVVLLVSLLTGIHLFFAGVVGNPAMWVAHIGASFIGVALVLVHSAYKQVASRSGRLLHFGSRAVIWRSALVTGLAFVVVVGAAGVLSYGSRRLVPAVDCDALGSEPLAFSRMNVTFAGLGTQRAYSNSRSCGLSGCHEGIVQEWKESAHYWSANHIFLAVSKEQARHVGGTSCVTSSCGACHFPVAALTGRSADVLDAKADEPGARHLAEQDEAASCVFCHSIQEVRQAGKGANTVSEPLEFVFASGDGRSPWLDSLYAKAVNMKPRAHGRSYTRNFYSDARACMGCHARDHIQVWASSPYHDAKNPSRTQHCQKCHMPEVPLANEVMTRLNGKTRSHRFLGANLTLPELYGLKEQGDLTKAFIADKRIEMQLALPREAAPGTKLPLVVSMHNSAVGHYFPAGPELDLAEAWVEIKALDESGRVVYSTGVLDEKNHLARDAYVYCQFALSTDFHVLPPEYRYRHTSWYWVYGLLHTLAPCTVDDVRYQIGLPADLRGKLRLQVALKMRKPGQPFMDWAFPGTTAPVLVVASAEAEVLMSPGAPQKTARDLALPFPGVARCDPYYTILLENRMVLPSHQAYQVLVDYAEGKAKEKEALERLDDLRRRHPGDSRVLESYARLLVRLGRFDEASAILARIAEAQPNDPRVVGSLAEVEEKRGNADKARVYRERAARIVERDAKRPLSLDRIKANRLSPEKDRELHAIINRGDLDKELPFVLINRDRLREMPADWGSAPPKEKE